MKHTGAARYERQAQAGVLGTAHSDGSQLAALAELPAWPAIRPAYSAGVVVGSLGVLSVFAGAALAKAPFVDYPSRHATIVDGLSRAAIMAGPELVVTYDPGFDPGRGSVFCQNHISVLDGPVATAVIPQPFCGLMNHWHFHVPGYGWLMKLAKGIPVFPRDSGRTSEITAAARERVAEGISILVFPEGHRTLDGNVRPFRRGVFFMARDAGIPVVPLAVRGLYDVNRKGQWTFEPGKVEIYVGPQVDTADMDDEQVGELAERMTRFADIWVREGRAALEVLP